MRELIFTDNEIGDSGVNLVEICKGIQRKVILSELWLSDFI